MESNVQGRIDQLAEQARARGIDWQDRMGALSRTDPRVVLAALATLLELDVMDVLDEHRTLEEAGERAKLLAESADVLQREAHAGGPTDSGGKGV
jgi:hypothetical protein